MRKRLVAALLCLCFTALMWPAVAFASGTAMQAGAGGIPGYDETTSTYNYLYFGTYGGSSVKWRVLDDQTNTGATGLFALSEKLLGTGRHGNLLFNETNTSSNAYQGSTAQAWCNTFETSSLTSGELAALVSTTKSDAEITTTTIDKYDKTWKQSDNILSGDQVFLLSAAEATSASYGFSTAKGRIALFGGTADAWWLRSGSTDAANYAGMVYRDGDVIPAKVNKTISAAARPAFNLDLDSVLFASAAEGGKSAAGMDSGLTAVPATTPTEWKLTLKDTTRDGLSVGTTAVSADGKTLTIAYSGATAGENEYLSAVVEDANGAVTHYGRLAQTSSASGTATIDLSSVGMSATDTLYVFSEQYNGDKMTDYAGALKTVSLTQDTNSITSNLTNLSSSSTTTLWSSGDGDYDTTLTADAGYLLPQTVTVTIGGTAIESGKVYDPSTGKLVIKEADITGNIVITASGVAETHVAAMTPDGRDFGSKTVGYDAISPATFTVTSTGTAGLANLAVTLSGTNAGSFILDTTGTAASLDPAGGTKTSTTFTVKPADGLAAGTYSATITISADGMADVTKTVSFTVTALPAAPVQKAAATTTATTVATATPQTGESGDAAMCISLLLASGVGLAAAGIVRRRATAR